jgi:hypothetical protein
VLFAIAAVAGGVALAFAMQPASTPLIAGGWAFFAACIALGVLDVTKLGVPAGSPRSIGWLLTALTAAFVPLLHVSGAWVGDSKLMAPAVIGTVLSFASVPWTVSVGPQTAWREGRLSPLVLAWAGVVLNFIASSNG